MPNVLSRIVKFYVTGFKEMTWGRTLWVIILIKLFVMFVILRIFFFPNFLRVNFDTPKERGDYVIDALTNQNF